MDDYPYYILGEDSWLQTTGPHRLSFPWVLPCVLM
jgi:hypothetical protein